MTIRTVEKASDILPRTEGGYLAEMRQAMETAEQSIDAYELAGRDLVKATGRLAQWEADRARQKTEAIVRLCQVENPATPGKNYSASQAADFAQLDPLYAEYKNTVAEASLDRLRAELVLESAKLDAQYAVAVVRQIAGLQ